MPNGDESATVEVMDAHLPRKRPPDAVLHSVLVFSILLPQKRSFFHIIPQNELKGGDPDVLLVTFGDIDGQRVP